MIASIGSLVGNAFLITQGFALSLLTTRVHLISIHCVPIPSTFLASSTFPWISRFLYLQVFTASAPYSACHLSHPHLICCAIPTVKSPQQPWPSRGSRTRCGVDYRPQSVSTSYHTSLFCFCNVLYLNQGSFGLIPGNPATWIEYLNEFEQRGQDSLNVYTARRWSFNPIPSQKRCTGGPVI